MRLQIQKQPIFFTQKGPISKKRQNCSEIGHTLRKLLGI